MPTVGTPDALSSALRAMQLHGEVFCRSEFSAPWCVAFPPGPAYFHVVESGRCWVRTPGARQPIEALAGDLVLLARAEGHEIASVGGMRPTPLEEVLRRHRSATEPLRWGGSGAETHLICGSFHLEELTPRALVTLLPPVLRLPGKHGSNLERLDSTLRALGEEVHRPSPGTEIAVSRLVDLIFVQALRHWLARQPAGTAGWLGAMRDPRIGVALGHMHAELDRSWSIPELARKAGMSRSAFASRFAALVGEAPLQHLARWRMQLAAVLLRNGLLRPSEVAARVGYESEAAFSRTFKRYTGQAPRAFRSGRIADSAGERAHSDLSPDVPLERRSGRATIMAAPS